MTIVLVFVSVFVALVGEARAFVSPWQRSSSSSSQLQARKPFITGNWKLNPMTRQEAVDLATGIANSITSESPCDVALFVPFPFIEAVQQAASGKLLVGAEVRLVERWNTIIAIVIVVIVS